MTEVIYYAVQCKDQSFTTVSHVFNELAQSQEAASILNTLYPTKKHSSISCRACLDDPMLMSHNKAIKSSLDALEILRKRIKEFSSIREA